MDVERLSFYIAYAHTLMGVDRNELASAYLESALDMLGNRDAAIDDARAFYAREDEDDDDIEWIDLENASWDDLL